MSRGSTEKLSIRINADDRPFLDNECLRIMQERFSRTRRLRQPSLGDVISELLSELRDLRERVDGEGGEVAAGHRGPGNPAADTPDRA